MPVGALTKHDPLAEYKEGVKAVIRGHARPIPLTKTEINVAITGVFATVKTARVFKNAEAQSIEATVTFPVPIDAVAHSLKVTIADRVLVGVAQPKVQARATYEDAIDTGKTAVLHEEVLKGIHILSIAHIGPGDEIRVEVSWSKPLSLVGAAPSLKIPTTVAEVYGRLPLSPADELTTSAHQVFEADVTITTDSGVASIVGQTTLEGNFLRIPLDRPIEIVVTGARNTQLKGHATDGGEVSLTVAPLPIGERPIRFAVLFDRSGSTNDPIDGYGVGHDSVWEVSGNALATALSNNLENEDVMSLWQFDHDVDFLGKASGKSALPLIGKIGKARGSTEIGKALEAAMADEEITDIVVVTDGRSGALDVQTLAARGKRVSAILCGANSLEAMIGHLVGLTGGQIVVASSSNIVAAFAAVIGALRIPGTPAEAADQTKLPGKLVECRGGVTMSVVWNAKTEDAGATVDDIGIYAAAIALPMLTVEAATRIAIEYGLCTHLTSLVVVDAAGAKKEGLPNTRKVPLSRPMESSWSAGLSASANTPATMNPTAANQTRGGGGSTSFFDAPTRGGEAMRGAPSGIEFLTRGPLKGRAAAPPTASPAPTSSVNMAATASLSDLTASLTSVSLWMNWFGDINPLVRGDIDHLSNVLKEMIANLAANAYVIELANRIQRSPTIVVIGLLARHAGVDNRNAQRVARITLMGEELATTLVGP